MEEKTRRFVDLCGLGHLEVEKFSKVLTVCLEF